MNMNRNSLALFGLIVLFFAYCATVPLTGRKQLRLLPENMLIDMSLTAYDDFLKEHPVVPPDHPDAVMLHKVGDKIADAVITYIRNNKIRNRIFDFEFNLVMNDEVNAWCMPGGKVVFYTGILPVTQDEAGMAVVMGHEIAHAVANHGNERMSQQMALMLGAMTLDVALNEKPEETRDIFMLAYGVSGTLGTLAYSRQHEYEADKLGMIFMAMAGYNPERTLEFWQKMSEMSGPSMPVFLSTHPTSESRVKAIQDFMPEAMKYYKPGR
jgi:predicted Zn-dependent protease